MPLSLKTKISYGIGGVADNAMYTLAGTYLLFFLTSVAGIRPAAAGAIVALGSVWEVICGPIVGYLSDHMESRFGKRKPFLLAAAFPAAIATSLLFTAIGAGYTVRFIFYLVMTLLYWQAFAMFFVPYMTWGSDLTDDYDERTILRTYAYVFNQIGMALGMALPTALVDLLMHMGRSVGFSWSMTGILVGGCTCACLLICALTIHDTDNPNFKKEKGRKRTFSLSFLAELLSEYWRFLHIRPIRYIIGASLVYLVANTIFSSDRVYFFSYNLGVSNLRISFLMLVITLVGLALAPAVSAVSVRWDKKNVFSAGIFFAGILMILCGIFGSESFLLALFVCIIYSLGNTCYWQLMPSLIYDVCEAEELFSGTKHSAQVISLQALSESLSCAIGAQLLGLVLELANFRAESSVQLESARACISQCFSIVPGILFLLVAFIIYRHPVNKGRYERILRALKAREDGEEVNLGEFQDIYGRKIARRTQR